MLPTLLSVMVQIAGQSCQASAVYEVPAYVAVVACNVWVCQPGGVRYADGVVSATNCNVDRIFLGDFR